MSHQQNIVAVPVSLDNMSAVELEQLHIAIGEESFAALVEAENRRQEMADAQALEVAEEIDPREFAARELEAISDGLPEWEKDAIEALLQIADVIRGYYCTQDGVQVFVEPGEAAQTLIGALYNSLVPSEFKSKPDGLIRVLIGRANVARAAEIAQFKEEREAVKRLAPERFLQFLQELARFDLVASKKIIDEFNNDIGLIKTLEVMVERGEMERLMDDPQIAVAVNNAANGRRANTFLWALQNRARATAQEAQESARHQLQRQRIAGANPRSGYTGRMTGKTSRNNSRESRESDRRTRQEERAKKCQGMRGHNETPPKRGKKKK